MNKNQKIARQTNWDKRCLMASLDTINRVEDHAEMCTNRLNKHRDLRADLRVAADFLSAALDRWPKRREK